MDNRESLFSCYNKNKCINATVTVLRKKVHLCESRLRKMNVEFLCSFFFNITLSQGNIFWSSYNLKWFFDVWFGCFLSALLNVIRLVSDKLSNKRMEISGLRQVDQLLWGEKSNSWVKQAKRVTFNVPIQYCYQLKYQIYKNHAAEHFSYLKKTFLSSFTYNFHKWKIISKDTTQEKAIVTK